uniref:non-specific serine/threonine protein kinase n=3 Tax=Caenorhabditis japonica TaxID=281687 RepID=A0A8R1EUJ6_CAEJA
ISRMPLEIQTSADHRKYREDAEELCSMMYRAPELFSCEIGSTLTSAVDVWSLGICLYEFFYLENPFQKVYEQGGSIALATQSPQMIKFVEGGTVSQKINNLIKSVLAVNPISRPSAGDLRKTVENMIQSWEEEETSDAPNIEGKGDVPAHEITDEEFDRAMREQITNRELI